MKELEQVRMRFIVLAILALTFLDYQPVVKSNTEV